MKYQVYKKMFFEIDAIQFCEDNIMEVLKFIGEFGNIRYVERIKRFVFNDCIKKTECCVEDGDWLIKEGDEDYSITVYTEDEFKELYEIISCEMDYKEEGYKDEV